MKTAIRVAAALGLAGLIIVGVFVLAIRGVTAAPAFTDASLEGPYSFSVSQVRQNSAGIEYCDDAGVVKFDGAGRGVAASTIRCSITGTRSTRGNPLSYSVTPDGAFTVTSPDGVIVHGQIVHRGTTLDGTQLNAALEVKAFHGVAAKVHRN
jgi:hypothetical protein